MTDHKYYAHDPDETPIPLQQEQAVEAIYGEAADRCLAWIYGNHPSRLARYGNLTELLCQKLKMPYGGKMAKLKLKLRSLARPVPQEHLRHLPAAALRSNAKDEVQRQANMKAGLKRILEKKASDCLIMAIGHVHRLLVQEPSKELLLRDDGRKLIQEYLQAGDGASRYIAPDRRWYCACGLRVRSGRIGVRAGDDPRRQGGFCSARGDLISLTR